jgi:hypothetical protein
MLNEMTISSLSPSTVGANGGVVITAVGTGFPLNIQSSTSTSISFSGANVKIVSVQNCQVQFTITP